jgi:hypothetical protein
MGKLAISNGKAAQWMAQSTEVVTPMASQLILRRISSKNTINATVLQIKCWVVFPGCLKEHSPNFASSQIRQLGRKMGPGLEIFLP